MSIASIVWIAVAATAALFLLLGGRFWAVFVTVILSVHALVWTPLFGELDASWKWGILYLQATVFLYFLRILRPRMPRLPYRALVSIPAHWFSAGTVLAIPWAVVAAAGFTPWGLWIPWAIAGLGVAQSMWSREEVVDLVLDGAPADALARHPRGTERSPRPLRIVQIADPHLGAFMSERRLRSICERAVAREPDLILLTGDFLTADSWGDEALLARALKPLTAYEGRVFACRGNHDLESPQAIGRALATVGVQLLIDEEALVQTAAGPVQILGIDYRFRSRDLHVAAVCHRYPRRPDHLRVILLHDPGAFVHVPEGEGDLVLSGHTHGGQIGLISLGLTWTVAHGIGGIPDHGFWARGRDRLYVHRGHGHYGFPLRLGVPPENSLVQVHRVEQS